MHWMLLHHHALGCITFTFRYAMRYLLISSFAWPTPKMDKGVRLLCWAKFGDDMTFPFLLDPVAAATDVSSRKDVDM